MPYMKEKKKKLFNASLFLLYLQISPSRISKLQHALWLASFREAPIELKNSFLSLCWSFYTNIMIPGNNTEAQSCNGSSTGHSLVPDHLHGLQTLIDHDDTEDNSGEPS